MYTKLILVPEKINLEKLLQEKPVEFDFNLDYGYSILHQILIDTSFKLDDIKNWKDFQMYKPIRKHYLKRSSKILQPQFRNYNKHLDYFCKNNIVWRDRYSESVCRKYQLAPEYFAERVRFVEITDRKVINVFFKEKNNIIDFYPLNKWLDNKLQIDAKNALKCLNSTFNSDMNWSYYLTRCRAVLGIANTHYDMSRNRYTDDRFHSSFTSIPKDLRKYLIYGNKRLGEVDISASVPFFLYCYMLYIVGDYQRIALSFFDGFFKKDRLYSQALKITKNKVKLDKDEVLRFGETLLNGTFYQQIMIYFDEVYYKRHAEYVLKGTFNNTNEDKTIIAKKMILSAINSKNSQHKETKEFMKLLYPTIMEFLEVFKTRRYLKKIDKIRLQGRLNISEIKLKGNFEQHKKVSHLLLQLESYFMLEILTRKLNKSHSKKPFFTLHDCIVTTEENISFLKEFMRQIFISTVGFSANFKDKVFV